MSVARLSAKRSKDNHTRVGACIVSPDDKIVATGYNGMPWGCNDDVMPWLKSSETPDINESKTPYVIHAEYNAIINKQAADVKGCTMYVTLQPCNQCVKLILQSGIKEVYWAEGREKKPYEIGKVMMKKAKDGRESFKYGPVEEEEEIIQFTFKKKDDKGKDKKLEQPEIKKFDKSSEHWRQGLPG